MVELIPPTYAYIIAGLLALWIFSRPLLIFARTAGMKRVMKVPKQEDPGIKFSINITKEDLSNKELMTEVKELITVSNPGPAQQLPKKMPKELELIAGLQQMGMGMGLQQQAIPGKVVKK